MSTISGGFAMRKLIAIGILSLFASQCWGAWNDPHVEGTLEHPLLKFYPQASVFQFDQKEFDSADVVTGYKKGAGTPATSETLEGRFTRYDYSHKPNTSTLEIVRQYENALKKAGFVTIVAGKAMNTPGLPVMSDDESFGSFRLDRNGTAAAYVQVTASYNGGADNPESHVTILEIKAMEQTLEANADSWFQALSNTGRVAVYGINFDTGKASIKPDSEKVLAEIKTLLASHSQLKLRIEGHTDNVGSSASNKKLSEDRAAAVKVWLVKSGAREGNLSTAGFGDTQPVADNKADDGRAKNRRVELVKQ
jgi:outer membrane protein OmpA-like peptidoglycan-associated protein